MGANITIQCYILRTAHFTCANQLIKYIWICENFIVANFVSIFFHILKVVTKFFDIPFELP